MDLTQILTKSGVSKQTLRAKLKPLYPRLSRPTLDDWLVLEEKQKILLTTAHEIAEERLNNINQAMEGVGMQVIVKGRDQITVNGGSDSMEVTNALVRRYESVITDKEKKIESLQMELVNLQGKLELLTKKKE
jgi:hypothetical protein